MAKAIGKPVASAPAAVGANPSAKLTWNEFRALVKRADKGDRKGLARLREVLASGDHPDWARWFRDTYGNPAEWLSGSLAKWAGGEDRLAMEEASQATMNKLRKELEGPDPTPIERLLAERAVLCWFVVNLYEALYFQSKDITIRQAEFQLRRVESAHRRFLSAVATLARVRKLALPALQVNIGTNQVNVAQPGG
jgi:hypothetical protein